MTKCWRRREGTPDAQLRCSVHSSEVSLSQRLVRGQLIKLEKSTRRVPTTQLFLNALVLVSEEDVTRGMFLQIYKTSTNPKVPVPLTFGRQ